MTCVIGLVEDGQVYIGADSAVSDGWEVSRTAVGKVFSTGQFLIGVAGSVRLSQVLHYHVAPRKRYENEESDEYMVCGFIEAMRKVATDLGLWKKSSDGEDWIPGCALVGFDGQLYYLGCDLQIDRYLMPFCAIGSGGHFAMGAMKALEGLPPVKRIRESLKVAACFSEGVRGPFVVKKL